MFVGSPSKSITRVTNPSKNCDLCNSMSKKNIIFCRPFTNTWHEDGWTRSTIKHGDISPNWWWNEICFAFSKGYITTFKFLKETDPSTHNNLNLWTFWRYSKKSFIPISIAQMSKFWPTENIPGPYVRSMSNSDSTKQFAEFPCLKTKLFDTICPVPVLVSIHVSNKAQWSSNVLS